MQNITVLERDLWRAADDLRANSKLTASEYSMPVLGLIFLRYAYNRFIEAKARIEETLPTRHGVKPPVTKAHFAKENAIFLPEGAQYETLVNLPEGTNYGEAINQAMSLIEAEYPALEGALPKDYSKFENDLLARLLRAFNDDKLKKAGGDVFGRIYEYFLNEFAMTGAQEGGEFFTPISLVQMIVNVIEPDHGTVLDPACGSAGMFVQTGHFIEREGKQVAGAVTFYGQEKAELNTRLARMNMAVHGLEGSILEGNTFYQDKHELLGKCDFVMANPPFNVDGVDAGKIKDDPRLPFGLPGTTDRGKAVSNGNYLWIQYFYSYLNDTGRAGFVMASSASDASHTEKSIREKMLATGHVDAIISIGTNFFYTRTLPCTLWFFDKGKPERLKNTVLMLDARSIYRKVTRKINDFSPEQLANLTAIVWLYRGQHRRMLELVQSYLNRVLVEVLSIGDALSPLEATLASIAEKVEIWLKAKQAGDKVDVTKLEALQAKLTTFLEDLALYRQDRAGVVASVAEHESWHQSHAQLPSETVAANEQQHEAAKLFEPISGRIKGLQKQVDHLAKSAAHLVEFAEKELEAKRDDDWDNRAINALTKSMDAERISALKPLKQAVHFFHQVQWLQQRFPEATFRDVAGLCKAATREEIVAGDCSFTPGRYVGVAQIVEEDEDFEERLREIQVELKGLDEESIQLATSIQNNFGALL